MSDENIFCMHIGVLGVNTYIVLLSPATAAIIDPGGNAQKLAAFLTEKNLSLEAILLTHTHFDHIGAVAQLKAQFAQAAIICHKEEKQFLGNGALQSQLEWFGNGGMDRFISRSVVNDMPAADVLLSGGEVLFEDSVNFEGGFKVFHTPGHSAGSVCFYNRTQNVLFSGDTLFAGTWGRTDFSGGSDEKMRSSLKMLLTTLPEETVVFPGHENFTTISAEKGLLRY